MHLITYPCRDYSQTVLEKGSLIWNILINACYNVKHEIAVLIQNLYVINYRQTSNVSRTLVGNEHVGHSNELVDHCRS